MKTILKALLFFSISIKLKTNFILFIFIKGKTLTTNFINLKIKHLFAHIFLAIIFLSLAYLFF